MYFRLSATLIAILASAPLFADSTLRTQAIKSLSIHTHARLADSILNNINRSGVPDSEVDSLVSTVTYEMAKCTIDSMDLMPILLRDKIFQMLADGDDLEKLSEVLYLSIDDGIYTDASEVLRLTQVADWVEDLYQAYEITVEAQSNNALH